MKKVLTALIAMVLATATSIAVHACGFHNGGYDTPSPYGWTLRTYDEEPAYTAAPIEKKKPVFSTAATRASALAKAKVKSNAENAEKQSDSDSVDKTTDEEVESTASL